MEIVVPELEEMRAAHVISIGSATLSSLTPYCEAGYVSRLFLISVAVNLYIPFLFLSSTKQIRTWFKNSLLCLVFQEKFKIKL